MISKKIFILFVLLGGLTALLAFSHNSAAAKVFNTHPPLCTVNFVPGVQYEVFCEDIGKDIINADLFFMSGEVKYKMAWDETMMNLIIPLDGDTFAPPQFFWMVGDKAGSVVKGSYP